MALPGGHGTFILENVIFKKQISFEIAHHCGKETGGRNLFLCCFKKLKLNKFKI